MHNTVPCQKTTGAVKKVIKKCSLKLLTVAVRLVGLIPTTVPGVPGINTWYFTCTCTAATTQKTMREKNLTSN